MCGSLDKILWPLVFNKVTVVCLSWTPCDGYRELKQHCECSAVRDEMCKRCLETINFAQTCSERQKEREGIAELQRLLPLLLCSRHSCIGRERRAHSERHEMKLQLGSELQFALQCGGCEKHAGLSIASSRAARLVWSGCRSVLPPACQLDCRFSGAINALHFTLCVLCELLCGAH